MLPAVKHSVAAGSPNFSTLMMDPPQVRKFNLESDGDINGTGMVVLPL